MAAQPPSFGFLLLGEKRERGAIGCVLHKKFIRIGSAKKAWRKN
jgi:hypothetical protein